MSPAEIRKMADWLSTEIRLACVQADDLVRLDKVVSSMQALAGLSEKHLRDLKFLRALCVEREGHFGDISPGKGIPAWLAIEWIDTIISSNPPLKEGFVKGNDPLAT